MIQSIIGAKYEEADAVVIGAPYGHGASFGKGAEDGPREIATVLHEQLEFFDRYSSTEPALDFKFAYKELEEISRYSPEHMVQFLSDYLKKETRFFVMLGGVHTVTTAALTALKDRFNPKDVTVVQLDAHFDLREDDSEYNEVDPSGFAHSTVMRRVHEMGFNILPVGIRTMYKGEYDYAQKNKIKYFEWGRADISTPSVKEIVEAIPTDKVYLTIDIDGFDPAVAPATGTPVPGGLSWEFGEELVREICKKKTVISADIVEVAPNEFSGQTQYVAAQLAYHLLTLHMLQNSSQ